MFKDLEVEKEQTKKLRVGNNDKRLGVTEAKRGNCFSRRDGLTDLNSADKSTR